jgi:hypothetical protein
MSSAQPSASPTALPKMPDTFLDYIARSVEAQIAAKKPWAPMHFIDRQALRALSYLYVCAASPLRGSAKLADEIRAVYAVIVAAGEMDPRLVMHVTEARRLLHDAGAADLVPGIDRVLQDCNKEWHDEMLSFRHLSHFTSANLTTSTNHAAMYATACYRIGAMLGRDDWRKDGLDCWERLLADQHPDGYWSETTGGPVVYYNHFTFTFAGRMGRWTGEKRFLEAARKAAAFHRRFHYPDGCDLETIDGRNRYRNYPTMWGGFVHSETPEGRAFVARKMATKLKQASIIEFGNQGGETAALMMEDHELWVHGPTGTAEVDRPAYVETLAIPAGVRKQGPWFACLQGILALPRGPNFTIDRICLLSLWHEKTGLIVNGSGEPGPRPAQSFAFYTPWEFIKYGVPERAQVDMGSAGSAEPARIVADYPGGTGRLSLRFISEREVELDVKAEVRAERYPITFTLALELRDGDRVNGSTLGEDRVDLASEHLRGKLVTDRFSITLPETGAYFSWPYDPYNPYDVHKRSPRHLYVSLLHVPVGPDGVRLRFTID